MKHIAVSAMALALTGCLGTCSTPTERMVTQVPVSVECKEKVPFRPSMPTEAFTAKPELDAYVKAADAEIVLREGYEVQLRTALVICTKPIIP